MSANAISREVCQDSDLPAESVLATTTPTQSRADKQDWLLGLGGMIVVATVIVLSIYSVCKYLL